MYCKMAHWYLLNNINFHLIMISSVPLVEQTENIQTQIYALNKQTDNLSTNNTFLYHKFKYNWALLLMLIKKTDLMMPITLFQILILVQEIHRVNMYCKMQHQFLRNIINLHLNKISSVPLVELTENIQTKISVLKMQTDNSSTINTFLYHKYKNN